MAEMLSLIFIFSIFTGSFGLPEQGIFDLEFTKQMDLGYITKSMFNKTDVGVKIECTPKPKAADDKVYVEVRWLLYWAQCVEELSENDYIKQIVANDLNFVGYDNKTHRVFVSAWESHECKDFIHIGDHSESMPDFYYDYDDYDDYTDYDLSTETQEYSEDTPSPVGVKESLDKETPSVADKGGVATGDKTNVAGSEDVAPKPIEVKEPDAAPVKTPKTRRRRAAKPETKVETTTKAAGKLQPGMPQDVQRVIVTNHDGPHLFALLTRAVNSDNDYVAQVTIFTKGPRGYLSAIEWPLLPFYGVMSAVYLLFGVAWLAMMFMNWRDLLRVQFWIGGVIFIGMLEKAVFFGEYQSVNSSGRSLFGALILAEIVSSMKRSLARVLVIIVSLGFGIVKPRLGPIFHKVTAVGTLYFMMGSIEGILRVVRERNGREAVLASIPLAVIDAAICWWVFTSLVQIMRTLRLRRNVVKLSLYRHFTNTLIFAVLASIVYMIWSIKQHRLVSCMSDWREIWVDDAFWHILFCIILGVIIVLWRPSANNQRFAFSPLLDGGNDDEMPEDEEKLITDAYDGMKKRNEKAKVIPYRDQSETDKDLQWIDDNIPASVADSALPSLLDSDEEVVTTKYEMSKME